MAESSESKLIFDTLDFFLMQVCESCKSSLQLCNGSGALLPHLCRTNYTQKMKTIKLFLLGMILVIAGTAQGQISVNVHIGTAPAWGPRGYDHVRYYYLPDVEAYYDVNTAMFIYISGNHWIRRSYLPSRYHNYNLYRGRKVVMNNYHGNSPYYNHKVYKAKYGHGNQGAPQRMNNRNNGGNRNAGQYRSGGNNRNGGQNGQGKNKGNEHGGNKGHGK